MLPPSEQRLRVKRLSKEDYLIESLKMIVDGIAGTFGSRCEVLLHDFRDLNDLGHSILKIANGSVTGRSVGCGITDIGLMHLRGGITRDLLLNYRSVAPDGRLLKSSSMVFRNDKGKPIAALCINFDVTDILSFNVAIKDIFAVSQDIEDSAGNGAKAGEPIETFQGDIVSTLENIADRVIRDSGRAIPSMGRKDKMDIVRQLEGQGFFLIKGAIKLIATKLRISKFTVYNYLEQIRSEHEKIKADQIHEVPTAASEHTLKGVP